MKPKVNRLAGAEIRIVLVMLGWAIVATSGVRGAEFPGQTPTRQTNAPGAAFFADPTLRTFQIDIPEAGLASLRRSPRTSVRATLREGPRLLTNVALHLKGMGSFRPVDEKASFAVKFDEFVPDQAYLGLTKLMFNNSVQDPTCLAEWLATGLFRDAGLPAARVTHARVRLNERELGLYVVIEGMNKRFLKQHFPNAKGNLYEGYLQDIDGALDQDNGDITDRADLQKLLAAAQVPDPAARYQRLGHVLDVDRFVSFVAMELLVGHWDGYAIHTNNYRLYHDPGSDRMVFITHGLDWAFRRPNISIQPPLKSIVGRAVLQTDQGRKLFRERIGSLFTNVVRVPIITNRLNEALARLRNAGLDPVALAKLERNAAIMRERIQVRGERVAEQLAGIEPSPPSFDGAGGAPLTGWRDESDRGEPLLDQPQHEGRRTLHLRAAGGRSRASWRTQLFLTRGSYQLEAMACAEGLVNGSAGLRISGDQRDSGINGTTPWRKVTHTFAVAEDGLDVEFVCDFYGLAGEAWFDADSIRLKRIDARRP